jgi:hypothetical protein
MGSLDGPIAAVECRETSRLAIRILVNAKANYGHIGEACERKDSFTAILMRN